MVKNIHHVGIVVQSLARAYAFWRDALGLPLVREAELPDQGVRAALLAAGHSEVELLEPTRGDTGVARFLAKRGEGLHHLCLETPSIDADLGALKAQGVPLLDERPRQGLAGRIAFLHPNACHGVLVELATPPPGDAHAESPVRFKRLVIGCREPQDTAKTYHQIFGLPEVAVNDGPRSMLGWSGGGTLLMVPASEVGGTLGMAALSMVAPEMGALADRLKKIDAVMFSGASEITLKPEAGNNVHLHISRYHFP
ncbi:MAG TPA: methylmalonyl-CoA epimerase [Methylomirabilota bacterium]|jgi:methylmalonyl-CoA/ethylmalonyl-CoA epimerase|nr:methylmalonyl-CoA epimerase [Methylomirabilota bacterium]